MALTNGVLQRAPKPYSVDEMAPFSPITERLLFVFSNLGVLLASWSLARLLVGRYSLATRVVAVTVGCPIIVIPTLVVLGALGQLKATSAAVFVGSEALILAALALRGRDRALDARPSIPDGQPILTGISAAVVLLVAAPMLAKHLLQATHFHWDDFVYHAPKVAHWLQAERLYLAPYTYQAYYPGNAELFASWFMLSSRFDAFNSLATIFWMALGTIAVFFLCRLLRIALPVSFLMAGVFLATRPFDFHAGSFAALDLAGAALVGAATFMAVIVAGSSEPRKTAGPLFYCSCSLGLAVGCKITFAPVALFVLLLLLFVHRREGLIAAGKTAAFFTGCALLCGGFWYIRNWILSGNPLFPADIWLFRGPLDQVARIETSLLYQLQILDGKGLLDAFGELLNWPIQMALVILAGYFISAVSFLSPGSWRDPIRRRLIVVFFVGLIALAVVVVGPFSGTTNKPNGTLHVRLRFFLTFALLGIPLAGYWINRFERARPFLVILGLLLVGATAGFSPFAFFSAVLLGAGVGWFLFEGYRERMRSLSRPIAIASALLSVVAAHYCLTLKQPKNDLWLSKQISGWNSLRVLPDGVRVAWYSTFEETKYYRAFGTRLRLIPVKTRRDGSVYRPLHEVWKTEKRTWWEPKPPIFPNPEFVENLLAQKIDYVYLMKRSAGMWPDQYGVLLDSARAVRVINKPSYALFELYSFAERDGKR